MEKVFAVSMFRDEEDVAEHVLVHLSAEGVDGIIVADNRSRDGTRAALEMARRRIQARRPDVYIEIVDDPEVGYYQSRKMTALATRAAEMGASWIIPFDADEVWHGPRGKMADFLREVPEGTAVARATILNHFSTAFDDPADPLAFRRFGWRMGEAAPLPKVAFRWQPGAIIHQGNHGVDLPQGSGQRVAGLVVRHFPYRSFKHFARKARNGAEAYAATDLPSDTGDHWRRYGQLLKQGGEEALREVWTQWFHFQDPEGRGLVFHPAPVRFQP